MTIAKWTSSLLFSCVLGFPFIGAAAPPSAADIVKAGIDAYKNGDFETAAKAFAEADAKQPDNPRIVFNRAAVLAAQGDVKQAEQLWGEVAASPDPSLAALADYNLGCIAANTARTFLGAHPEEASVEDRQRGRKLLEEAIAYYRNCLKLDSQHDNARYNLEMIRLWTAQMESVWRDHDRQTTQAVSKAPKEAAKTSDQSKPEERPVESIPSQSTVPKAKPEKANPKEPGKPASVKPYQGPESSLKVVVENPLPFDTKPENSKNLTASGRSIDELVKKFLKRQEERRRDQQAASPTSRLKAVEKDW